MCLWERVQVPAKARRGHQIFSSWVTCGRKPPNMGAGNQTQVLGKRNKCLSLWTQLSSLLSIHFLCEYTWRIPYKGWRDAGALLDKQSLVFVSFSLLWWNSWGRLLYKEKKFVSLIGLEDRNPKLHGTGSREVSSTATSYQPIIRGVSLFLWPLPLLRKPPEFNCGTLEMTVLLPRPWLDHSDFLNSIVIRLWD